MILSCDCSADIDYANRCSQSVQRRARKPHTCVECGRAIKPGERYWVDSGIDYDGHPFRYSTCLGCYNIRERYCSGGWYFGEVAEQCRDCFGFDYTDDPKDWDDEEVDEEDEAHREWLKRKADDHG